MFIIEYVACDSWTGEVSEVNEQFNSIEEANQWLKENEDWVIEWRSFEVVKI